MTVRPPSAAVASFLLVVAALLTAPPALAQEPPTLPAPSGPYEIGVLDIAWTDAAREEPATPEPGDRRRAGARVWYPAVPTEGPAAEYMPGHAAFVAGFEGEDGRMAALVRPLAEVTTHAVRGAPTAPGGPFPVVLVSPGGNVTHFWHQALAEDLASHGWIAASILHPHSGLELLEGTLVRSIDWGLEEDDPAAARRNDDRMSDVLAADAAAVLDRLIAMGAADGVLAGVVDAEQVGIVGHSRGGSTVGRLCSTDDRIDACIVLDNIGPDTEAETGLPKPHLALRAPWSAGRVERLRSYLRRNAVAAWDVEISGAHHFTFTDLGLFGFPAPEGSVEPARGHRIAAEFVRAFLDRHVRGAEDRFGAAVSRVPEATGVQLAPE